MRLVHPRASPNIEDEGVDNISCRDCRYPLSQEEWEDYCCRGLCPVLVYECQDDRGGVAD